MTFTEEIALRSEDSNGWTFVDCVKPRLFRSLDSGGETAVASRIKQIGDSLRYLGDPVTIDRVLPLVDQMLDGCPSLSRVIKSRGIPVGLPTWLGGLGHPVGLTPGYVLGINHRYRELLCRLDTDPESLVHCLFIPGIENPDTVRDLHDIARAMLLGEQVSSYDDLDYTNWIHIGSLDCPRLSFEKFSHWQARRRELASELGLVTLMDFVGWFSSSEGTRRILSGEPDRDVSIAHRLRLKQEYLLSLVEEDANDSVGVIDSDIFRIFRSLHSIVDERYWDRDSLISTFALGDQPSFKVEFQHAKH
jgi:hypothetical protein